jgi:hypothetical protein
VATDISHARRIGPPDERALCARYVRDHCVAAKSVCERAGEVIEEAKTRRRRPGKDHEISRSNGIRRVARCVIEDTIRHRAARTVARGRPPDKIPLLRQFRGPQRTGDRAADQTEPEEADAHGGEYRSQHVGSPGRNAIAAQRQPPAMTSGWLAATDHQPTRSERRSSVRRSARRRSCPFGGPGSAGSFTRRVARRR